MDENTERRMQIDLRRRIEEKEENLRDKFAMAALTGLVTKKMYMFNLSEADELVVVSAYRLADAMMRQRKL